MGSMLQAATALAVKDWLRLIRRPFLLVVGLVMPLVFVFFYAIVVPTSATNPVVVAAEGQGPAARAFLQVLRSIRSQEGPYYEVVTTDPTEARRQFEGGEALGLVVIPADFDARLAAGRAEVELHIRNINSDYSKNLRLRLDHAVRVFTEQQLKPAVTVQERAWLSQDPRLQDYISTSLLLFACLYSAMVSTGQQVAGEWSERTIKTLLLAPADRWAIVAGKMLAGLAQALLSVVLVLATLTLVFDFHLAGSAWALAGIILAVMLLGAGVGAAVGVMIRQTLPVISVLVILSIGIFLVSGNEDTLRGLAWAGPVVGLWWVARALPTTYAFLAARSLLLTGDTTTLVRDLSVTLLAAAAAVALGTVLLRRAYSGLAGGQ